MIRLTKNTANATIVKTFPDSLLANVCLQVAGGGWTTAQTAKAMCLQSSVKRDGKAKIKNVLIELVDDTPVEGLMFDMAYEDQCRDACGL